MINELDIKTSAIQIEETLIGLPGGLNKWPLIAFEQAIEKNQDNFKRIPEEKVTNQRRQASTKYLGEKEKTMLA